MSHKLNRITSLLALAIVASTAVLPVSAARAGSDFSAEKLERSMFDLYCQFPDQKNCPKSATPANPDNPAQGDNSTPSSPNGLSSADTAIWALEIFDQIAMLELDPFNDVMTHLSADYRQHPEHRQAIELVLSSAGVPHSADVTGQNDHTADAVRERLREELSGNRKRNPVITVMDDVLIAFSAAYLFEFGRGFIPGARSLWATSGEGVTKLKKFGDVVRYGLKVDVIAKGAVKSNSLKIFAAGLGVGLAEAAIQSFRTYKIDPHHLLEPIQRAIVQAGAVKAAAERDELRAMTGESDDKLRAHADAYRKRMPEIESDAKQIKSEMEHLYEVAPQCRPQMDPVAQDITEILQKLAQLGLKLDGLDLQGAGGLD